MCARKARVEASGQRLYKVVESEDAKNVAQRDNGAMLVDHIEQGKFQKL